MTDAIRTAWKADGLVVRHGGATLDLAAAWSGVAVAAAAGTDRVLGLDLRTSGRPLAPADHWLRGDDAVAVYEPADPRRLRATAMWRPVGERAWELVVSAQTALGESDSSLAVTCDLATGQLAWGRGHERGIDWLNGSESEVPPAAATCLLVRRPADAVLVAVHPADARRIMARRTEGRVHVACWLFSAALEKGVLLRSRVLAATGPAAESSWAETLAATMVTAPPPLTA